MRFSTTFFVSVFTAIASAQNMFTMATLPTSIAVGSTFNITWQPTTQGSVSLLLVQAGSPGSSLVHQVSTIAANITNSGAFAWIPSSLTAKGSGYAIEIIDDANPYITNYSGQFAIDSTTQPSSSVASVSGSTLMPTTGTTASASTGSSGTTMTTTGSAMTTTGSASTTLSTVTSSGSSKGTTTATSSSSSSSSSATATAKSGAAGEMARSGLGLLAAVGVAVLFL